MPKTYATDYETARGLQFATYRASFGYLCDLGSQMTAAREARDPITYDRLEARYAATLAEIRRRQAAG